MARVGDLLIILLLWQNLQSSGSPTIQKTEWYGDPILVWTPVIEPEVHGVERYLAEQPVDLIRKGKFHHVPFITGVTKDEFGGNVVRVIQETEAGNDSILRDLNSNWTTLAPISFLFERDTNHSLKISEELKKFYFNNKPVSLENIEGLAKIYADSVIGFSTHRFVNLMAKFSSAPVYYYKFSYQGRYSHIQWNNGTPYGVVHHDDLLYLFNVSYFPQFEPDAPEITTVERWTTIWTNFATTDEPIPKDKELFKDVVWETFTDENELYLDFDKDLVMKSGLFKERMDFWDKLFPLPASKD